jgi:hypothetical protein
VIWIAEKRLQLQLLIDLFMLHVFMAVVIGDGRSDTQPASLGSPGGPPPLAVVPEKGNDQRRVVGIDILVDRLVAFGLR